MNTKNWAGADAANPTGDIPLSACKLVTIVCEAELENDLVRDLQGLEAKGYTITDARGRGARGVRDASWTAGANIRVEVLCDERIAAAIVKHLAQRYYAHYAMVMFVSDVAVLRPEKFST